MNKPPEIIYLIPEEVEWGTVYSWLWCEDPAPGTDMKEKDAVKYKRVDEDTKCEYD